MVHLLESKGYACRQAFHEELRPIDTRQPEGGFFEGMMAFERGWGVKALLKLLFKGELGLRAERRDVALEFRIYLRIPEDRERKVVEFKNMIAEWVSADKLTFSERFFRLPNMSEDVASRYFENPLEHQLRKTFGFHFKYKVIISSASDCAESHEIRAVLYKMLSYS